MDSEIARNGSGYYDPTAFEAMKNIIKKKEGRTLRPGISMKKKKVKNLCEKAFATCL